MTDLLPLFVNLAGRRVLVVGGGPVAASKLTALLAAGADVRVVAPEVHADIEQAVVRSGVKAGVKAGVQKSSGVNLLSLTWTACGSSWPRPRPRRIEPWPRPRSSGVYS